MNPLTNMKNIAKLSQKDLHSTSKSSWHDQYRDSAWVFIGGLPFDLTEGDIICIFSQYGEVVNINLIRAKDTGKSKGFCFLCYEDQRSTILAVDNLNGIKILNRAIRVDHVQSYKVPKQGKTTSDETKKLYEEGCAPKSAPPKPPVVVKTELPNTNMIRETLVDQIEHDIKLPARLPIYSTTTVKTEPVSESEKSLKEDKKEKKKKKKSKKRSSDEDSESSDGEECKKKKRKSRDKEKKHKSKKDDPTYSSKEDKKTESSLKKDQDKRSERSRSRDREPQPKRTYIRGVSPSLPKRWR